MATRKHVFLALDAAAWGRVALAVDIARELIGNGDEAVFIVHSSAVPILRPSRLPYDELGDHLGLLTQLCVETFVQHEAPQSIILCDFHSCSRYLKLKGIDPGFITELGIPVIAMDIWNCIEAGPDMDLSGGGTAPRDRWNDKLSGRLVPVPIGGPESDGAYCSLPPPIALAESVREHIRQNLGLADEDHAVLFCTAGWQHTMMEPHGRRLAQAVPQLLWNYLHQADPKARLIHVGPAPLTLEGTPERYQWMPSLSPENFDRLLASVDLLLTANISATTIGRAMMAGLPVLAVENSFRAQNTVESEQKLGECGKALTPPLRQWVENTVPLYPFRLWPLGYWEFLGPLMSGNPYCSALDTVELLDEAGFVHRCRSLLLDPQVRQDARSRQAAYVAQVRRLPPAAGLIDGYLTGKGYE
jgi:hypothetical protein